MIYVFNDGSIVYDESTLTEEQKRQATPLKALPPKADVIEINIEEYLLDYEFRLSMLELGL